MATEDKTELHQPGWRVLPANTSWMDALELCPEPWRYHSDEELDSEPIWGSHHLYGGGGYPARLGYDAHTAEKVVDEVFQNDWVDRQTRVVMLEFTIFNVNTNLICIGTYLYEALATGYAHPKGVIETLTLYSTDSAFHEFFLICQFLFLVMVAVLLVRQFLAMYRQGWGYFRSLWSWVQLFQIVFSVLSLVIHILRAKSTLRSVQHIQQNPYANVGFHGALSWAFWEDTVLSLAIFLATFKLLHIIRINPHVLIMSFSLKKCFMQLYSYMVIFFLVFFSFAQSGMLIFGHSVQMYSTFPRAVVNQFEFLLGKAVPLESLERENRVLGPFFSFTYMGTMTFLLINFFIVIINDSYEEVREDVENRAECVEMANFMNDQVMRKFLFQRPKRSVLSQKLFCDDPGFGETSMCFFEAEPSCINAENVLEASLERLTRVEGKVRKLDKLIRFSEEDVTDDDSENVNLIGIIMASSMRREQKVSALVCLKEF